MIILKVRKKQGFTLSLEITYSEKPRWGDEIDSPIFLGLTMKTPKQCQCRRFGVFIVNFEQISLNILVFSSKLTLNK